MEQPTDAQSGQKAARPSFGGEFSKEEQGVVCAFNSAWGRPNGFYQRVSKRMPFLAKMSGGGNRTFDVSEMAGPVSSAGYVTVRVPVTEFVIRTVFSAKDIDLAKGNRQALEKLATVRAQSAMDTTMDVFGEVMFGNGKSWNGKAFNGIRSLLNDVDGGGKVPGVDAALPRNAKLRNQVIDLTTGRGMGPNGTHGGPRSASPAALMEAMDNAYRMVTMHGDGIPDCVVTDRDTYALYEQSKQGQHYKGIVVMQDRFCPKGMMYMINTDQMHLRASDRCNMMAMSDVPIQSDNQTAFFTCIRWVGQTWITNRRNQVAIRISTDDSDRPIRRSANDVHGTECLHIGPHTLEFRGLRLEGE